jgi:hypothetical protein
LIIRSKVFKAGKKPGLVVKAEGSHPRGRGFESTVYWMDVSDASYYIFNEKGNKSSQMGHKKNFEKILKKKKKKKF